VCEVLQLAYTGLIGLFLGIEDYVGLFLDSGIFLLEPLHRKHMKLSGLGLTFGVGMGPNKVLAKTASKYRKPAGFTSVRQLNLDSFLKETPISRIWGIGPSTAVMLGNLGIKTAFDLASKEGGWLTVHNLAKPCREIWQELRGKKVKELTLDGEGSAGSVIKSRTFSPHSSDPAYLLSQLSKNVEAACIQVRRYGAKCRHLRFYLKTKEFVYHSFDVSLSLPLSTPVEMMTIIKEHFNEIFQSDILYRATGVSLSGIIPEGHTAVDLFGESEKNEKSSKVFSIIDRVGRKYGLGTIYLGSSILASKTSGKLPLDRRAQRKKLFLAGDRSKLSLDLPFLGRVR